MIVAGNPLERRQRLAGAELVPRLGQEAARFVAGGGEHHEKAGARD
jgi:hypothetical protein